MQKKNNSTEARCWAVVPAAGSGRRMGETVAKQYLLLAGRPVIHWALKPMLEEPRVSGLVVVLAAGDCQWSERVPDAAGKLLLTTQGGSERGDSVFNGLQALRPHADDHDWVLVHDAARPCLNSGDLDCLLGRLWDDEVGGLLATPVRDTLKREDINGGTVKTTVDRSNLWLALTPQMFRYGMLYDALDQALSRNAPITDEAAAMEMAGLSPRLVEGRWENLKITYPKDLLLAEQLLALDGQL